MNRESRESSRCGIKSQHYVPQAIRCNHLAVLANHQIVKAVFPRTLWLEASQQFSGSIKMQEFRSPAVREGIGPHRVVTEADADAQNRQKSVAVRGNEVGTPAVSAYLYNLPAIEAAQIKNIPLCIVGQTFWHQIFLRCSNCFACLRHLRKIPVHIFN